MKNRPCEKISEYLLNVDDDIIANAYEVDNAEKLDRYIKKKNASITHRFYMSRTWQKISVSAACMVLIVCILFSMPNILSSGGDVTDSRSTPSEYTPPIWQKGDSVHLTLNSIAKLSYYAALRMISDTQSTVTANIAQSRTNNTKREVIFLSVNNHTDKKSATTAFDISNSAIALSTVAATISDFDENIYCYELDPNEPFYINKVSMFQIELTDERGFLASKLGMGIVDVAITEECIGGDSLITFRNGENFYSCLVNGFEYDSETNDRIWNFSTHKYVDGFFIVKNFAQENYSFYVRTDASGQTITFECRPADLLNDHSDKNITVVSSTVISDDGSAFTIAELENYFNSDQHTDTELLPSNAAEMPQDTSLEFWVTENVSNCDLSKYCEVYGMIGGRAFYGNDYHTENDNTGKVTTSAHYVSYLVTPYPDYASGGEYITRIDITDPKVTVCGLTVNSDLEEYIALFEADGYELSTENTAGGILFTATRSGITFELFRDFSEQISRLTVKAEVTNHIGIVF